MRVTELKLRQIIRGLLWEAGDPDSDADDAAELRDIAADIESGQVRRSWDEEIISRAAVDLADADADAAGIPSFLDWAQEVADLVQSINGIEEIPDSTVYGLPYDAWSLRGTGGHVPAAAYASSVSDAAGPGDIPGRPGSRQHYEAWVADRGHITGGASSVLATYMIDQGAEDNKRLLQHLATSLGIDPDDARRELLRQRAEAETDLGRSEQDRYMADFMSEAGMTHGGKMSKLMNKMLSEARFDWSAETGAVPREGVPWEFGPEGYAKRPELQSKMKSLAVGPHTDMLTILRIALSNRAEELVGYAHTVDPAHFRGLSQSIMKNYIMGMSGDKTEQLHDIVSKIDAGDYFDEDIDDVHGWRDDVGAPPEGQGETLGDVESGFDIPAPDESNFPLAPPEGTLTESRLMQLAGLLGD